MNQFDNLPSESEITPLAQVSPEEQPYDGGGWAGDGSGTDDFADHNANEASDYADEDRYLDSSYEDRTEMDFGD